MRLYLVQHGEALPEDVDAERPLSEVGRADVDRLAVFLERCGVRAARVLHSGKTRAHQTAQRLAEAIAPGAAVEVAGGVKPKDSAEQFAARLTSMSGNVLVASHQPFLGRLVSFLVLGREDVGCTAFTPGTLVGLDRDEAGHWQIALMIPPAVLREAG